MGYVTPTPRATDDLITAAIWNQDVVDNVAHLGGLKAGVTALGSLAATDRITSLNEIVPWTQLAANAASINIANIPADYHTLLLLLFMRTDYAAVNDHILMILNGDSAAANYDTFTYKMSGSTATLSVSQDLASLSGIALREAATGANATANLFSIGTVKILNYADGSLPKHVGSEFWRVSSRASGGALIAHSGGVWHNTSVAVSSIGLAPKNGSNIVTSSGYALYGIGRS